MITMPVNGHAVRFVIASAGADDPAEVCTVLPDIARAIGDPEAVMLRMGVIARHAAGYRFEEWRHRLPGGRTAFLCRAADALALVREIEAAFRLSGADSREIEAAIGQAKVALGLVPPDNSGRL